VANVPHREAISIMSFGQPPTVDDLPHDDAWREIEEGLEALALLAESDVTVAEFEGRLLERLVAMTAAEGGIVWSPGENGWQMSAQLQVGHALAGDAQELSRHGRMAEQVAASTRGRCVPPAFRDAEVANASPWLVVAAPVLVDGRGVAVLELFQRPDPRAEVREGYLRVASAACEIAAAVHQRKLMEGTKQREQSLASLIDYGKRIHQELELPKVGAAVANESRRIAGCDRVSLVAQPAGRPRLITISGVETFDRKSGTVRGLERLATHVLKIGEALWLPEDSNDAAPAVTNDWQELADETHTKHLGLVPVFAGVEEEESPIGVLVWEQFAREFTPDQKRLSQQIAQHSGAALRNAITYDRIPLRAFMQWLATMVGMAPGQRWPPAAIGGAVLALAAIALCVIPADFAIEARGELMPCRRQNVFAPSDGVVLELPRHEGDSVEEGQLLAKLHSPSLDLDESELIGKQRTAQEDLLAAETASLDSEREPPGQSQRGRQSARVLQLKEELNGLKAQLSMVRQQQRALAVTSPLKGTVISWDAERELAGRPVKRGDLLLTVADVSGSWEILLDVPDRRIGHVLAAERANQPLAVTFQLGTDPGAVGRGELRTIAAATQLWKDSEPAVRVVVDVKDAVQTRFRPGATVVGRIQCGRRPLGYVWLHELWETLRLRLFI